jgi:hypothetical protein
MKTTIDIHGPLLQEAKRVAARERTTVRALVEQGLRQVLSQRKRRGLFRLKKVSVKGNGLQAGVACLSWERMRELAYEGRGT